MLSRPYNTNTVRVLSTVSRRILNPQSTLRHVPQAPKPRYNVQPSALIHQSAKSEVLYHGLGKHNSNFWWTLVLGATSAIVLGSSLVIANAKSEPAVHKTIHDGETPLTVEEKDFNHILEKIKENDNTLLSLHMDFILSTAQLTNLAEALKHNKELGYIEWKQINSQVDDINKRLAQNNKNYRDNPNDYIHALLSKHAYRNSKEKEVVRLEDESVNKHLEDWVVAKVYDDTNVSGYYSAIYINNSTHQIVLANRGTEGIIKGLAKKNSDWKTNLKEIWAAEIVIGQQAWNYLATKEAVRLAKKQGYHLSFTGHSLGAWLAELSAYYSHAYFDHRNVKAVTFDSPGSRPMMEKLESNIESHDTNIDRRNIEIVTYLAAPNPVNSCNQHVGKVYRINPEMSATKWLDNTTPTSLNRASGGKLHGVLSIEGHMLGGIVATFNPETGKPREYCKMADWPRFEYTGKEKSFALPSLPTIIPAIVAGYVLSDTTIMSMVSLAINIAEGNIDQTQYWAYYESIDIEIGDGKSEPRKDLPFDKSFKLIAKAKYRADEGDVNILNPTRGSTDEWLYELSKIDPEKINKLPNIVKEQLKDLVSTFKVEKVDGHGKQYKLVPTGDLDIEAIRQRMRRLTQVMPKEVLGIVLQKLQVVHNHTYTLEAGKVESVDKRTQPLLDNIPTKYNPLNFVGREDKYEEVGKQFEKQKVVIISGEGGVGKSSLAGQYANSKKRQEESIRWIRARNGKITEQYKDLADELGVDTKKFSPEKIRDAVYAKLGSFGKEVLLVVDNMEDKEEGKFCLQNLPNNVKLLITTRNNDLLSGYKPIMLNRFNETEKLEYLKKHLTSKSEKDIKKLAEKVSSSPLDLNSVKDEFKNSPSMKVKDYLIKLEQFKNKQNPATQILYPATQILLNELGEEAKEILKYCAYLDADMIPIELLLKIIPDQERLDKGIIELSETTSLLNLQEQGIYSLHEELQECCKDKYKQEEKDILTILVRNISTLPEGKARVNNSRAIVKDNSLDNSDELALLCNQLGHYYYYELQQYEQALEFHEKTLSINKTLYPDQNHKKIALSLSNVGNAHGALGDTRKGLEYQKESLKMFKELHPEDHDNVADALNKVGIAYEKLGNNSQNTSDHKIICAIEELKYKEEALEMRKKLHSDDSEKVVDSSNNVATAYVRYGQLRKSQHASSGKEKIQKGIKLLEDVLTKRKILRNNALMSKKSTLKLDEKVASTLNNLGNAHRDSGEVIKGVTYLEEALKIRKGLRPTLNYHPVGSSLYDLGSAYEALGDQDKALECFKQSYSVSCALGGENYAKNKDSAKGIKKLQPDFFTRQGFVQGLQKQDCVGGNQLGSECRRLIFSHGNTSENLITLKQKIQNIVLNKIVTACHNYGWSDVSRTWGDYGVKSYINQTYLKGQLGDLGNEPENLEEAQMLCFESMNLGIMKSDKKPYKIAESFCRSNPELVKRIAKEHPEFFVDGSIVEACIRAIPQDKEFADLLKQNVRYMGMDRETARGTGRGI